MPLTLWLESSGNINNLRLQGIHEMQAEVFCKSLAIISDCCRSLANKLALVYAISLKISKKGCTIREKMKDLCGYIGEKL